MAGKGFFKKMLSTDQDQPTPEQVAGWLHEDGPRDRESRSLTPEQMRQGARVVPQSPSSYQPPAGYQPAPGYPPASSQQPPSSYQQPAPQPSPFASQLANPRSVWPTVEPAGDASAPDGVDITEVAPGSPLDRAGVREGDVITAVRGVPTPDEQSLMRVLGGLGPGEHAEMTLDRDGIPVTVMVTAPR